ncbi:MAG: Acetyltransferase, partial [Chloroflexi bacterium]|nr:Acetyltransferase [Chloroflexota bacterium]
VGMTEAISVQPEHRRRGLARALLAESLRAVRDAGADQACLGVDTQNPNQALTLYESLGFRIVSETFEYQLGPFAPGVVPDLGLEGAE